MKQPVDSKNGVWATPQDFFDKINVEFSFGTDVCALPDNAKCQHYYSPEQDGLAQEWTGTCWMNPPYGHVISKWVRKAANSPQATVVGLLPARTDTRWFHDHIYGKAEIRFLRGRIKFSGRNSTGMFPSMLVIWRKA